jgi:hypothetical protein
VLRDEDGMMSHGRLLAVVRGGGGRQTLFDERGGVLQDHGQTFASQVFKLPAAQAEPTPEGRFGERGKEFFKIASRHVPLIFPMYSCALSLTPRTAL